MTNDTTKWDLLIQVGKREAIRAYPTWDSAAAALKRALPRLLPAVETEFVTYKIDAGPGERKIWVCCSDKPDYCFIIMPHRVAERTEHG